MKVYTFFLYINKPFCHVKYFLRYVYVNKKNGLFVNNTIQISWSNIKIINLICILFRNSYYDFRIEIFRPHRNKLLIDQTFWFLFIHKTERFNHFTYFSVNVYSSIASSSYAIWVINLCSYYNNMVSWPNPTNQTNKSVIVVM